MFNSENNTMNQRDIALTVDNMTSFFQDDELKKDLMGSNHGYMNVWANWFGLIDDFSFEQYYKCYCLFL